LEGQKLTLVTRISYATSPWLIILLCLALLALPARQAASADDAISFRPIEFAPQCSEIRVFDINGDGLSDLIGLHENSVAVFLQSKAAGFSGKASASYTFGKAPALISPAKLGDRQALLVANYKGMAAYEYAEVSGAGALTSQSLIQCENLLPQTDTDAHVAFFPLTIRTGKPYPLILLPMKDGLGVWGHRDDGVWQCLQKLPEISEQVSTSANGCYYKNYHCSYSIWDSNHDGRDDLLFDERREYRNDMFGGTFRLYEQSTQGMFPASPSQIFQSAPIQREGTEGRNFELQDINGDGRIDRIENSWDGNGPVLPGAGRVMVSIFLSGADNTFPQKPQWVFRKNDGVMTHPIDIDGDGKLDLPLGYSQWKGREDVARSFTAKKIDYSLRFHFFGDQGYSESPDCQRDLALSLEDNDPLNAINNSAEFELNVLFDGDFNGDGRRDLLARDEKDAVSIYYFRSRKEGFSSKPDLQFMSAASDELMIEDVNGDGVSDLLVIPRNRSANLENLLAIPEKGKPFRVYVSIRGK
jgi:hypothetical protein